VLGFAMMVALTQWARKRNEAASTQEPVWLFAGIPAR
jgi:hypothetical protein